MLDLLENSTVITANRRLAAYLHRQYDQQQAAAHSTWPTLDCLPLSQWLRRSFETLPDSRYILSQSCEIALWEKIITANNSDEVSFLRPYATAQQAMEAWRLLSLWGIPLTALDGHPSEDVHLFQQWAYQFQAICQQQQWLDESSLVPLLHQHDAQIQWPQRLTLAGFIDTPPQITRLLQQVATQAQLQEYPTTVPNKSIGRITLRHEEEECYAMAVWAKKEWQHDPTQTIGCVVPALDGLRHKVMRIFGEVFTTDGCDPPQQMPFNLSGGNPLSQFPIIHIALTILHSVVSPWPLEKISAILRSPFIGGSEQEYLPRTMLDLQLRQTASPQLSSADVLQISQQQGQCAVWLSQLTDFQRHGATVKKATLNMWAQHFIQCLHLMGWPGERRLNSAEYQLVQRWQALLNEFSQLSVVLTESLDITAALYYLQQLVESTVFQPESGEKPIQILGLLEAVGMPFSALWVSGMHDQQFPAMAAPNPFLPLALQQKAQMPHASAEKEFLFSQQVTQRFCQSAEQVVFSYGKQKKDVTYQASSLIAAMPEIVLPAVLPRWTLNDDVHLEIISEEQGPTLQPQEILRGGGAILKEQAACPFRSFAKIRLNANALPTIDSGISLAERGVYVHEILERLWDILKNHDQLCRYPLPELSALVDRMITETLALKMQKPGGQLKRHFLTIEKQRLQSLILRWLDQEKARPFFTVKQREFQQTVTFAGLPLTLRMDRLDELADGSLLIIDYKTGQVHIRDWFGDRPDDPQLLLYALVSEQPIQGLVFASIRHDQCGFKGLGAASYAIPGLLELHQQREDPVIDWQDFIAQRRAVLTQLAIEFQAGIATVTPKSWEKNCENCDLHMLCRIEP